jgi:hypothetical protein
MSRPPAKDQSSSPDAIRLTVRMDLIPDPGATVERATTTSATTTSTRRSSPADRGPGGPPHDLFRDRPKGSPVGDDVYLDRRTAQAHPGDLSAAEESGHLHPEAGVKARDTGD